MSRLFVGSIIGAAAVIAVSLVALRDSDHEEALKAAQGSSTAPSTAAPRTADGKPDFSGIWDADRRFIYDINDALKPGETLPLQPWALKLAKERMSKDDPVRRMKS